MFEINNLSINAPTKRLPKLIPYLLIAPALLFLLITIGYPVAYNIYISFFDWDILESQTPANLVGWLNYFRLFQDWEFWNSVLVTLKFTLIAVAFEFLIGFGLALALNEKIWGRRLLRTVLIAPIMATPLVVGLIWRLMWHAEFGIVNYFLSLIGGPHIYWLAEKTPAFIALTITEIWNNSSFVFLVLIAALQMLPDDPYEAAIVDGASYWQRVRHITLPLLRMPILVALMFRVVFTIRLFDQAWALTRGGPQSATMTMSMLIYKAAFEEFRMGPAAALSIMLLILTGLLSWFLVKLLYRGDVS